MDRSSHYYPQVQLLLRVLPFVFQEECFALKGGTAINLFVRNFISRYKRQQSNPFVAILSNHIRSAHAPFDRRRANGLWKQIGGVSICKGNNKPRLPVDTPNGLNSAASINNVDTCRARP